MQRTKYKWNNKEMKTYLYVLKIFPCWKYKFLQKKQVNKQHTTILVTIAYTGNKGRGEEICHTLILSFHLYLYIHAKD